MTVNEYNQVADHYQEWQDYKNAVTALGAKLAEYPGGSTAKITIEFKKETGEVGSLIVCSHGDKIDGRDLAAKLKADLIAQRDIEENEFDTFTGTAT